MESIGRKLTDGRVMRAACVTVLTVLMAMTTAGQGMKTISVNGSRPVAKAAEALEQEY